MSTHMHRERLLAATTAVVLVAAPGSAWDDKTDSGVLLG